MARTLIKIIINFILNFHKTRGFKRLPRCLTHMHRGKYIELWCNGSTTDFDSVSTSSTLVSSANKISEGENMEIFIGIIIGTFLGSALGVCVMALISVSGDSKEK